jgi:short-subunit dehydrogenase
LPNFQNKVVIITGASAGVGAETARAFAKHGAKLVLIARGQKALTEISNELSRITDVLSFAADVCATDAYEKILIEAENHFGDIHILINNAGYHKRGDVEKNDPRDLAKMVEVNLSAPIALSALTLPYIQKHKNGAIVNVGSLAGRAPLQGAATYSATKAGLRAFTYALADEVDEPNIHIGLVSPGPIDTGFIMSEIDDVEDIVFSQEMSSAQQVAQAILDVAAGKSIEISLPKSGGRLTMLSYLFPWLRRKVRPALYKKGRKEKEKYRQRNLNN